MTQKESVLITGAASGLGKQLAIQGHARGHRLYLVDILPEVADVAAQTQAQHLVADLADRASLDKIAEWAGDAQVLINNAGIAAKASFHEMDTRRAERIVLVNILAPLVLSRIYLERFKQRGAGTLINISSAATYFPTPGLAPYGASKAFLTAFTQSLIAETLHCPGIKIMVACPSGMDTNFQQSSGVRREHDEMLLDPAWVAKKIFDDWAAGRCGVRDYGWSTHLYRTMQSLLPHGLYIRLIEYLMSRYR